MKMQRKVWVRLLCLLTVIVCVLGLTACGQTTCEHEWGDWTTVKPATCTEAGSQERACAKCGEKETSAINALGHSYTAETVKDEALKSAATCTEAAVYYKSCSCGAIGTETFTSGSALDHKDENHDHTCDNGCGAVLEACSDAANDNNHACDVCGKADVSEHTYGEATCEQPSACSECGATTGEALGHKDENHDHTCDNSCGKTDMGTHADATDDADHLCDYGCGAVLEACSDAANDNNHACDVCGKADVSEHTYGEATCEQPSACSECGATTGEALGHLLHEESIDFGELGACDFILYYETCLCGEFKVLDFENSDMCEFEMEDSEGEPEYDEDGNIVVHTTGVCPECGLEVDVTATYGVIDCEAIFSYSFTFKLNGEIVIENVCFDMSFGDAHDEEETEIDLSEYGCCGGTLYVYKCVVCGEITGYYNIKLDCDLDDAGAQVEEITDENGIVHTLTTLSCSKGCGFAVTIEEWTEILSACETETYMIVTFRCGEETILELTDSYYEDMHEYEYEYVFEGDTCEDGVGVTATCSICGDSYEFSTEGHYETEYEEIDLSEYGCCGGTIAVERCIVCGEITSVHDRSFSCDMSNTYEAIVDDEGNEIGHTNVYSCSDCGFVLTEKYWTEQNDTCFYTQYNEMSVCQGEKCIFEYAEEWSWEAHDYECKYELEGETCDEGYYVTAHCTVCGADNEWWSAGHEIGHDKIELFEHGCCHGVLYVEMCEICGEIVYVDEKLQCDFESVLTEEYEDENGVAHTVETLVCSACGLKRVADCWSTETESACVSKEYCLLQFYVKDELFLECLDEYETSNHEYEPSYEGNRVTIRCTVCGLTMSYIMPDDSEMGENKEDIPTEEGEITDEEGVTEEGVSESTDSSDGK